MPGSFFSVCRTPDHLQQNGYNGNYQKNVNDATGMISEEANSPGYHQNNSDNVKQISHKVWFKKWINKPLTGNKKSPDLRYKKLITGNSEWIPLSGNLFYKNRDKPKDNNDFIGKRFYPG
jgi:hypothetical protein